MQYSFIYKGKQRSLLLLLLTQRCVQSSIRLRREVHNNLIELSRIINNHRGALPQNTVFISGISSSFLLEMSLHTANARRRRFTARPICNYHAQKVPELPPRLHSFQTLCISREYTQNSLHVPSHKNEEPFHHAR